MEANMLWALTRFCPSQLAVNEHRAVHSGPGFIHSLVQRETNQDFPRRSQSH
jgi:hypothetical protein